MGEKHYSPGPTYPTNYGQLLPNFLIYGLLLTNLTTYYYASRVLDWWSDRRVVSSYEAPAVAPRSHSPGAVRKGSGLDSTAEGVGKEYGT
jgi:hypothetical protein